MPDPGSIPLADLMSSLSSVVGALMVGAILLVLWQLAILFGALIANLRHRTQEENGSQFRVG